MENKVQNLIETIQKNLDRDERKEAVENDKKLTEVKTSLWSQVTSQAILHKNQFDFIFKHKIIYRAKEVFYLIIGGYLMFLAVGDNNDLIKILMAGLSIFMFFQLVSLFRKNMFSDKMMDRLYDRIVFEKSVHVSALDTIDEITMFQQETHDKMRELYNEEQDNFINDLGIRMREELKEKYPDLKNMDDEQ